MSDYDELKNIPPQEQPWPGITAKMDPVPDHGEAWYTGSDKLKGRRALITGGDSGIGRAIALMYAREGADVAISYLNEDEDAEITLNLIADTGQKGVIIPGDITDMEQCRQVMLQATTELGGLDILVHNAAYQHVIQSIEDLTLEEVERVFRTNLFAQFWLTQAALPHLKSGSSIICTGSVQGLDGDPELLDYACSKAALHNFVRALAKELVPKGIRVNAVAPGPVWTPLIPTTFKADSVAKFGSSSFFGRAAMPAEIAPAYVYLASDDARYVTGELIAITGQKIVSR